MNNPGWVDLQVNGCVGVDFSSPDLTADAFLRAAEWMLESGTALFLPTVITSAPELYRRNLPLIRETVRTHGLEREIPGLHLEGPFLSPGAIGSHNPAWTLPPTPEAVDALCDLTEGFLRLITLGADTPGAPEAIRRLRERGVAISVGHHLAGSAEIAAAAEAGAAALTHLGNGVPNLLDRHRNPIWAGLAEDRLTAMLITDGHHLPAELIKVMLRVKGAERVIVTSDTSSAAGLPPGPCRVLGNDAILEPDGRLHNPAKQCLVASASTLSQCMAFLESLELLNEKELRRVGRENALRLIS